MYLVFIGSIIFLYKLQQLLQRLQRAQRARRQARPASPPPRRAETNDAIELVDLEHRRGSRAGPRPERELIAENQGSETNPEDPDVDGPHGRDLGESTDNFSLAETVVETESFT